MLFADLLSLHLVTFLMFFILVHVTFLAADACLSWSLPSITEQLVSPHRLPMQYWLKNYRLSSNTPRTPTVFLIQQPCVIAKWFVHMLHGKKKWRRKGSHSSSVSGSNRLVWLQTWKKRWAGALLSEKCCCFVRKPSWKIHVDLN